MKSAVIVAQVKPSRRMFGTAGSLVTRRLVEINEIYWSQTGRMAILVN